MEYLSSNSMLLMERSMNYLWNRQAAISDNIANAETPGYKAKIVTFEENLKERMEKAMRSATPRTKMRETLENANFSVFSAQESTRMDDNGVNVTEQMVELVRNAYQLQYVMNAISTDFSTLRTAIGGK